MLAAIGVDMDDETLILWFDEVGRDDVPQVGGKNASLGEMIGTLADEGIRVPGGFATTADAYRRFIEENELETVIREEIDALHTGTSELSRVGRTAMPGRPIPTHRLESNPRVTATARARSDTPEPRSVSRLGRTCRRR